MAKNKFTNYDHCICGKVLCYKTKEEAERRLRSLRSGGYKGKRMPTSVHRCEKAPDTWHVTSRMQATKLSLLEEELHVATLRQKIISFMEETYNRDNSQYKFSTAQVADALTRKSPMIARTSVNAEISKLRKEDILVTLDEKVPNTPGGAKYFVLAKHLEEVTKPKTNAVIKEEVKVPEIKPIPSQPVSTPANPFEKVNNQLAEILTKVNGLAQGYSEITKSQRYQVSALERLSLAEAPKSTEILAALQVVHNAIKSASSSSDYDIDALNRNLADTAKPFMQRLKIMYSNMIVDQTVDIKGLIDNLKTPSSVTNSDDYKLGLKDGIKMAVEMGLILPDA